MFGESFEPNSFTWENKFPTTFGWFLKCWLLEVQIFVPSRGTRDLPFSFCRYVMGEHCDDVLLSASVRHTFRVSISVFRHSSNNIYCSLSHFCSLLRILEYRILCQVYDLADRFGIIAHFQSVVLRKNCWRVKFILKSISLAHRSVALVSKSSAAVLWSGKRFCLFLWLWSLYRVHEDPHFHPQTKLVQASKGPILGWVKHSLWSRECHLFKFCR